MLTRQDKAKFKDNIIPDDLLSDAIIWIQSNLEPSDVFKESQLEDWALANGYETKED